MANPYKVTNHDNNMCFNGKHNNWWSAYSNQAVFIDYYTRLKEYAINMFKWHNLPPTVDERFLELCLFEYGYAVFFKNKDNGQLMALNSRIDGRLNVYRVPLYRTAYATNGFQQQLTIDDSVLIFNNYLRQPTTLTIELFAKRLYEVEQTIMVNMKSQKFTTIFKCPESQRLTFKNIMMQWDGNEPFIFGDKNLDINSIEVINAQSPYNIDKMDIHKNMVWNEAMTFLGIDNANTDKKERLVEDEVTANNGQVEASRYIMLNARHQACKQINEMFAEELQGKKVWVTFRTTNENIYEEKEVEEEYEDVSRETLEGSTSEGGSEQPNE